MSSPSALLNGSSSSLSLRLWSRILGTVAVLSALALMIGYIEHRPKTSQEPHAMVAPGANNTTPQDDRPDAPMPLPIDLYRFALHALLVPLLDDDQPPRWTEAAIASNCGPGTSVMIDGKPMVARNPIPAVAFIVRWNMDHCSPFGQESLELSGAVEMVVFHEDDGLSAIVRPERLRVDSHMGWGWLRGPFTAELFLTAPPLTLP